ncbi:hypothetical protein ACFYXS_26580 [Streptomyces sp. NPDC002574]|uniref:hypothetical protein n=1 Tax=Streptomyces sp. NPDC002574 TaxID=3364652 RepID=UPI0036A3ED06
MVSLALTASACGSSPAPSSGSESAARGSGGGPSAGATTGSGGDGQSAAVDACTLLTPEEVAPVIGKNDGGRPTSGVGDSVCGWENPETYHSITVSVGGPGTAASGGIKDEPGVTSEAGPEGIRFLSGGIARFAAGDRDCQVQVVSGAGGDDDKVTAVKLVGLLRDRI